MKLNKLYLIIATSATLLSTNAYAWHNEITKNFKICNETGVPVKVGLEHFHNVKWQVPGGSGWNTKKDFPLAIGECGTMNIQTDWGGYAELSRIRLVVYGQDDGSARFAVDIRSETTGRHEGRTADGSGGNKINVFNVHNVWQKDGWNILAPIKQSYVYELKYKKRCNAWDCIIDEYVAGWKNHDEGLIGIKNFADGAGLALLFSKSDTQDLYLVSEPDGKKDELDQVLAHEVYDNFPRANIGEKQEAIKTLDGKQLDMNKYPNLKLCQVYQPEYTLDQAPKITTSNVIESSAGELFSKPLEAKNHNNESQLIATDSLAITNANSIATELLTGWKAGAAAKLSGKFTVPGAEKGYELSVNYEYNASMKKTETKTDSYTVTIPSQVIKVPPKSKVRYQAKMSLINQTGNYTAQYNLDNFSLRGKAALDGNCANTSYVSINPYPIIRSTNAKLDNGIAVNPDSQKVAITIKGTLNAKVGYKTELEFFEAESLSVVKKTESGLSKMIANPKDFIKPLN